MAKFSIIKNPIFIPKIGQAESSLVDPSFGPAFLMDAHIVDTYKVPAKEVAKRSKIFIIDPVTNYFIYKHYRKKKTLKNLSYSPSSPFKVDDLIIDEKLRMNKLIKPVIDFQIKNKAGTLILPYLFTKEATNVKFSLNLSLISDSLKYIAKEKISKPIFAMINMGTEILEDPKILNYIIERYDDDFGQKINGYFIILDDFDARKANKNILLGLAYLVFQLSRNKDVFILKMGSFGEILCAIGASGFSSGLFGGESFSEKSLREESKGFGRSPSQWIYVPEFLNYLKDEKLKRIGYSCSCPECKGSIAKNLNSKKRHFLHNRTKRVSRFVGLSRDKRISLMKAILEKGISIAKAYTKKHHLLIEKNHLEKWHEVLTSAENFDYRDEQKKKEINLDKLIHEARAKKKKK